MYIPIFKKGDAKESSVHRAMALPSHAGRVVPEVMQHRLLPSMEQDVLDAQAGFRKEEALEI